MSNEKRIYLIKNTNMRVNNVRLNLHSEQFIKPINIIPAPKETPIKDALIVSGYVSLPIVIYEVGCWFYKKFKQHYKIDFFA